MVKETRKIWGVRLTHCLFRRFAAAPSARLASSLPLGLALGGFRGFWSADDDYTHHYRPELRLSASVDKTMHHSYALRALLAARHRRSVLH